VGDLGDLGSFLKDGSLANLDWLNVNESDYRDLDNLPKQNLDVSPDLEALWGHDGSNPTSFVPNRGDAPRTVGDLSAQGNLRAGPEDVVKVARLALMQSSDTQKFRAALVGRFDQNTLRANRAVIAGVLAERGLLGKLYISAEDFPGCHRGSKKPIEFVRKFAGDAQFVLAKPACSGCIHSQKSPVGASQTCSVFHKEIQIEVPYSDALAAEVEQMQRAKGKDIQHLASVPRERVRLAMLAPNVRLEGPAPQQKPVEATGRLLRPIEETPQLQLPVDLTYIRATARETAAKAFTKGGLTVAQAQDTFFAIAHSQDESFLLKMAERMADLADVELAPRVYQGMGEQAKPQLIDRTEAEAQLISVANLTKKREAATKMMLSTDRARPVVELLRREMLKGRTAEDVASILKQSFQSTDLQATKDHWGPIFREAGVFGVLYATQESFDDCRTGHDFLAKHNPGIKVMVAGSKCGGCIYNKIGRCLLYGKPLVASAEAVLTWDTAERQLQEHKASGRIQPWGPPASEWGASPREALQKMHRSASLKSGATSTPTRMEIVKAFHSRSQAVRTSALVRRDIVKVASRFMNEGLYGKDLLMALKGRFDSRDLAASAEDLRPVIAEQGLQGIYFVDPSIYDDYGKGCDEASRLHRARLVEYVKTGSRCGSCVLQTRSGFCSKLNKPLVEEPPYYDKLAQQREIMASGAATEIPFSQIMNNGQSMMVEYEMQHSAMDIDLNPVTTAADVDVELGTANQGFRL
jgi:hypothetical protein